MNYNGEITQSVLEAKCQSIIWNLLMTHEFEKNAQSPAHYIRLWLYTEHCDNHLPRIPKNSLTLKSMRDNICHEIGEVSIKAIREFKDSNFDNNRALQTMLQYNEYEKKALLGSLTYSNLFYYYIMRTPDKILALIGLSSVSRSGLHGTFKNFNAMTKSKQ